MNLFESLLAYYTKEEKPGEVKEWGKEPPPAEGGAGGIKDIFKRRWLK